MAITIRLAERDDAQQWLELLYASIGYEYPAKEIYDLAWIAGQFDRASGHETWVAETDGRLHSSITFLAPADVNANPVANLGRNLYLPESYENGAAEALMRHITRLADERNQMIVARVPASDNAQQKLCESVGCVCVGYQPLKHLIVSRQGTLFYVLPVKTVLVTRLPLSQSLPQVTELASLVLQNVQIAQLLRVKDGATGYPLHSDLRFHDATCADFEVWHQQLRIAERPLEISTGGNRGSGLLRTANDASQRAILGQHGSEISAGLAYLHDVHDHCVRILDAFSTDEVSMGALLQQVARIAQDNLSTAYLEVDVLMTAPRLLKTAEQLGFVPVAYLPAFYSQDGFCTDVVKMVKLNMAYELEFTALTDDAAAIVGTVDQNFEYYKSGVVVVDLLRRLGLFDGLGDGELRKLARLFMQKLYRPGEVVFERGDPADHVYVVMRGQINIYQNEAAEPIGCVQSGQMLGELAFLEPGPRTTSAVADLPSILVIIERSAFGLLVQQEPHLGLAVMRNLARDLSHKLRRNRTGLAVVR